jgi:hypothetical protein
MGQTVDVKFMLRPRSLIGWLLLLGGGLMALPLAIATAVYLVRDAAVTPFIVINMAAGIVEFVLGLFIVRGVRRTVRDRLHILTHGVLTNAIVTDQRRGAGLALLLGWANVVFDVAVALPGGGTRVESFSTPIAALRDELTIDSQIQALVDPLSGEVLFPAQFGVRLVPG